ncbi:MAG: response regulator [Desulfobacterales bacterium]|nr:MAG: response regulator [Desulfobacterales bacterium]UCD91444.1 MAG: response regulator [Desulfobacterales bacterium]
MNPLKILVVDDEPDMRIFVSTVVETMGFDPIMAENGTEALEKVQSILPALIILDVMMPKIEDGVKTYQLLKTDKRLDQIPIIMLSAIAKKTFFHFIRILSPQNGPGIPEPEAYMEKPPDAAELVKIIENLLLNKTQK